MISKWCVFLCRLVCDIYIFLLYLVSNVSVINICTVMDAQSKRRAEDYAVSSLILVCAVFSFITQSVCIYVHQHSYKLNDYGKKNRSGSQSKCIK